MLKDSLGFGDIMNFSDALTLFKQSKKLRRKSMPIIVEDMPKDYVDFYALCVTEDKANDGESFFYSDWEGSIELTTEDILAEDWELFEG